MNTRKKAKTVALDERGRMTLPYIFREGVASYVVEPLQDGSIRLVPQKAVSKQEAEILESLKRSIGQYKKGVTKKVPDEWKE